MRTGGFLALKKIHCALNIMAVQPIVPGAGRFRAAGQHTRPLGRPAGRPGKAKTAIGGTLCRRTVKSGRGRYTLKLAWGINEESWSRPILRDLTIFIGWSIASGL